MKFLCVLALWMVVCAVAIFACNPDGNNKPVCSPQIAGQKFRNFWDPTRFWLCPDNGTEPIVIECEAETLYDAANGTCIRYQDWRWTNPCPANA